MKLNYDQKCLTKIITPTGINTKKQLITLLKKYRGILSNPITEYLNSLIELEFSVIKDYISNKDRIALSELEIYKKIARYNIYNRALKIFSQNELPFPIASDYDRTQIEFTTQLKDKNIKLFCFNYDSNQIVRQQYETTILNEYSYKTMEIGTISLYQTLENKEVIEQEKIEIWNYLNDLYATIESIHSKTSHNSINEQGENIEHYIENSPSNRSLWNIKTSQNIIRAKERLAELDTKIELSNEDKKEIEITKYIHDLLLEDYGLTYESFKDKNDENKITTSLNPLYRFFESQNFSTQKKLVKKMPNLTIESNIKYI